MKKDKQMNVRLDKDMDKWLKAEAKRANSDRSKITIKALELYRDNVKLYRMVQQTKGLNQKEGNA